MSLSIPLGPKEHSRLVNFDSNLNEIARQLTRALDDLEIDEAYYKLVRCVFVLRIFNLPRVVFTTSTTA